MKNEIILFENQDVKLEVNMQDETVWLNQLQMAKLFDKDRKDIKYTTEVKLNNVKAPIEKGSKVGKLILKYDNNTYTYDLVIHDEVKKATFLKIFFSNLKDIVTGHVKQ